MLFLIWSLCNVDICNFTAANAWLWHQLGSFQHHWSDELHQIHLQGEGRIPAASTEHPGCAHFQYFAGDHQHGLEINQQLVRHTAIVLFDQFSTHKKEEDKNNDNNNHTHTQQRLCVCPCVPDREGSMVFASRALVVV